MNHKTKALLIGLVLAVASLALYGAGTTINGARTILNGLILGTDNSAAGTLQIANGSANAHTIFASGATTTNTIAGFATAPTTGHIVTCTVSGTTCTLTDGGAVPTGGLVLLEQHTASTSASLDFTTCISSTYDDYKIELLNLVPVTDNVDPLIRVSTDGGMNYDTGNNYFWVGNRTNGSGTGGGGGSTLVGLINLDGGDTMDNSANWGISGYVQMFGPGTAIFKKFVGSVVFLNNSNAILLTTVAGSYNVSTAVNAFQFIFSSGSIASGTARCYGIAK